MKETELARHFIDWLELEGWDVYQEVGKGGYGGRSADIVAKRGGVIWVIETKTSFTLDVMKQAEYWVGRAHFVSVGIPSGTTNGRQDHDFRKKICELLGIGVLVWKIKDHRVEDVLRPKMYRKMCYDWDLKPEMKVYCNAGATSQQHRFTPFRKTVDSLVRVVEEEPGIVLKEAITRIKHHYGTPQSAISSLKMLLEDGAIKELVLLRYPTEKKYELRLYSSQIEWNPDTCYKVVGGHSYISKWRGLEVQHEVCEYCKHINPKCVNCEVEKKAYKYCPFPCPISG